jgi:signal transduction histidine kinase
MWPTGSVHQPIGPAMTTLRSTVAPLASTVRAAGIVYIVVQVAIWYPFYFSASDPWRLAGPALAVAWGAAVTVRLRRGWPSPLLAVADSAVYVVLALAAQECIPPQIRDDMFGWLVISMSGQLIVPAWYAPGGLSTLLTLITPVAYWIGANRLPVTDSRTLAGAAVILIVVGLAHNFARRVLYRRAAATDAAVAEAARAAGDQFAVLSRNIERREHERLLHDTVLNTLTALTRASADDGAAVMSRCRRDVALIEDALGDPDDLSAGSGRPPGDLVSRVRTIVVEMRDRGLTVHLDADDSATTRAGTAGDGAWPAVPARVSLAFANATREALGNVAAHAGTEEAWVRISLTGEADAEADADADADAGAARGLRVTVRDHGAGFDPARVDRGRLGLRRSIEERTAECGGRASIRSAPGQGTEVSLCWPASAGPAELASAELVAADRGIERERLPW